MLLSCTSLATGTMTSMATCRTLLSTLLQCNGNHVKHNKETGVRAPAAAPHLGLVSRCIALLSRSSPPSDASLPASSSLAVSRSCSTGCVACASCQSNNLSTLACFRMLKYRVKQALALSCACGRARAVAWLVPALTMCDDIDAAIATSCLVCR
jgi:hypothetical protein